MSATTRKCAIAELLPIIEKTQANMDAQHQREIEEELDRCVTARTKRRLFGLLPPRKPLTREQWMERLADGSGDSLGMSWLAEHSWGYRDVRRRIKKLRSLCALVQETQFVDITDSDAQFLSDWSGT